MENIDISFNVRETSFKFINYVKFIKLNFIINKINAALQVFG